MGNVLHPDGSSNDSPGVQPPAGSGLGSELPQDLGEFAVAGTAANALEAQLLMDACGEASIPAILRSPRSGPVGTIASPVDGFQIWVPQSDLPRAEVLLRERRAALREDPDGAARAAEEEEAQGEATR